MVQEFAHNAHIHRGANMNLHIDVSCILIAARLRWQLRLKWLKRQLRPRQQKKQAATRSIGSHVVQQRWSWNGKYLHNWQKQIWFTQQLQLLETDGTFCQIPALPWLGGDARRIRPNYGDRYGWRGYRWQRRLHLVTCRSFLQMQKNVEQNT